MTDELVLIGDHAEHLSSGRVLGLGQRVRPGDLGDEDQYLIDDGRLVPVSDFGGAPATAELEGDALTQRARDLDIQGRSKMTVDELRAAIAAREAEDAASASEGGVS